MPSDVKNAAGDVEMNERSKDINSSRQFDKIELQHGLPNNGFDDSYQAVTSAYDASPAERDAADSTSTDTNRLTRLVIVCQTSVNSLSKRHYQHIKIAFLCLLIAAYFSYFGYAMYYYFGDEGSVRLLWITCLVVVCMALKLALHGCRKFGFTTSIQHSASRLAQHHNRINWAVLITLYALVVAVVIADLCTVSKNAYNLVSLSGMIFFVLVMFVCSFNPAKVKWMTVLWGINLQFILALIILRWDAGYSAFEWLGDRVAEFLAYTNAGSKFVFGENHASVLAFYVLPVVVFFSSVVSVLFYWGTMQFIIRKVAWIMYITMGTTAAESMCAAANIFIGQTEAPLVIRPLLPEMTKSELHSIMTTGFATIAGSVMSAYILFGVPANHLLSASVMSAPAALACAKLFYPETEVSKTTASDVKNIEKGAEVNAIDAAATGASNAVSLAANIAANLIAFIAILEFLNATLTWFGQRVGIESLTFQLICSYVLWPLALMMGVNVADCRKVAALIGTKTFLNEFIAYLDLGVLIENKVKLDNHIKNNGSWYWSGDDVVLTNIGASDVILTNGVISARSVLIATYALCGFANVGSIGIQLGGLGALAPSRRSDLASVAVRAMIAGNIACFMTACIGGLFFQEE